jgi:hypothetical protein
MNQPAPTRRRLFAGRWYFVVTIASAGLLAWVPFAHAAARLGRRRLAIRAAVYGAAAAAIVTLLGVTPTDAHGNVTNTAAATTFSLIGMSMILAVIGLGCVQQSRLRREVYEGAAPLVVDSAPDVDPAVAAILTARTRRDQARELAGRDPLMAHELRVGRPDLPRTYDDGGLVDLNTAPVATIAQMCELDATTAEAIVAARANGFLAVDDVFALADVPIDTWTMIRDRGIIIRS